MERHSGMIPHIANNTIILINDLLLGKTWMRYSSKKRVQGTVKKKG